MIKPRPTFRTTVAQADMSVRGLALAADVSYSTITGALTLNQPQRKGGVSERTAWKLARALAEKTGEDETAAFERLFERIEHIGSDGRRIKASPA